MANSSQAGEECLQENVVVEDLINDDIDVHAPFLDLAFPETLHGEAELLGMLQHPSPRSCE